MYKINQLKLILFLWLAVALTNCFAQERRLILTEDFQNLLSPNFIDLSKLHLWGPYAEPTSCFEVGEVQDEEGLSFNAIKIKDGALPFVNYTRADGLKTAQALDFRLPFLFDRTQDTLIIEVDMLSATVGNSGEAGRMVLTLMHEYPEGGPMMQDIDSVNKAHAFGRPSYNTRIMNKNQVTNNNLAGVMMYGGGHDREGEVEIFRRNNDAWWLPGFSTEAGGFTPGSRAPYPFGGAAQLRNNGIASATHWVRFTWEVSPRFLKLFHRKASEPETANRLAMYLFTPEYDANNPLEALDALRAHYSSNISALPTLYNYFGNFKAFRIFWAGGVNASVANLNIRGQGPTVISGFNNATSLQSFKAYPNPSKGVVYIECAGEFSSFEVIDTLGKTVASKQINEASIRTTFHDLKSGIYILVGKTYSGKVTSQKIVVN